MGKLIGKISGNDWSVAPEGAEYVDMNCRYESDTDQYSQWDGMFVWLRNEDNYWDIDGEEVVWGNDDFYNKDRYISRERDLEGIEETTKELVKYSSLKELPLGWFVKDVVGDISMWNGHTLCVVNPEDEWGVEWGVDCWNRDCVSQINGWKYPCNDDYSIVAYADRYNGEWIPVDDPKEIRKKELQEQIAKLTKELEEL